LYSGDSFAAVSVTSGEEYYIRVSASSGSGGGTWQIAFNASSTPPPITGDFEPEAGYTTLNVNTWADGNIAAQGGEQWYRFTATASTQYIHADFGTLDSLKAQLYNSAGSVVGSEVSVYQSEPSPSITVTNGQVYFMKVWPSYVSYTGDFRIAFNEGSSPPPLELPDSATPLTAGTWTSGNIAAGGEQWFTFTAAAAAQYIHFKPGTLTRLYVQVYDHTGVRVDRPAYLQIDGTRFAKRSVTNNEVYYIKVWPSSGSYNGGYQLAFNADIIPPGVTPAALTGNTWTSDTLPENGEQWYQFTAAASRQYIHFKPGTMTSLYVQVYDSTGNTIEYESTLDSSTKSIARTVSSGAGYYIRVRPYSSPYSGGYEIGFNASIAPPESPTLTAGNWEAGNIPQGGEQWFTFTATAAVQYIHVAPGTLESLYVQLYDSTGSTVGNEAYLSRSNRYSSSNLTNNAVYYIKVRPSGSASGGYRITFNTSFIPPGASPVELTADNWASETLAQYGEQWFTFTATANTQYIHFAPGTLTHL
jgi:hypothetical protein